MVEVIEWDSTRKLFEEAEKDNWELFRIDSHATKWLLGHEKKLLVLSKEFGRPPVLPMVLEIDFSGLKLKAFLCEEPRTPCGYSMAFATSDNCWLGAVIEVDGSDWQTLAPVWSNDLLFSAAETVQIVLTALNTKGALNQKQMTHSEKLQKARQKAGKPRLADYTMVTINLTDRTETIDRGGSHNSPRAHMVRGHFKKIKEKLHWWGSFMRGDATKGFVTHDYKVTASE